MSEKKRLLIYPYTSDFTPILRYFIRQQEWKNIVLISPAGLGLAGKDGGMADQGEELGITVQPDSEEWPEYDIFLVAESTVTENLRNKILNKIIQSAKKGKEIYCTIQVSEDEKALIKKACIKKGSQFFLYFNDNKNQFDNLYKLLYRPSVPVVFIGGIFDGLQTLDIADTLRFRAEQEGYRVCMITKRQYGELIGAKPYPLFLYTAELTPERMIEEINMYFHHLEDSLAPDLFIVELPGALLPFDLTIHNGFGILPFIVSQAVQGDYLICSIPYGNLTEQYLGALSTKLKYLYRCPVDYYMVSNKEFDIIRSRETGLACFNFIENFENIAETHNLKFQLTNFTEREVLDKVYMDLINKLSNYVS